MAKKSVATMIIQKGPGHSAIHTYGDANRFLKDLERALEFYTLDQITIQVPSSRKALLEQAHMILRTHEKT